VAKHPHRERCAGTGHSRKERGRLGQPYQDDIPYPDGFDRPRHACPAIGEEHDEGEPAKGQSHEPRLAEVFFDPIVEQQPRDGGGYGTERDQPEELAVAGVPSEAELVADEVGHASPNHSPPILPEVDEESEKCSQMQPDVERQALVGPLEERRDEDEVPRGRNWEEFREALNDSQDGRAKEVHAPSRCGCPA